MDGGTGWATVHGAAKQSAVTSSWSTRRPALPSYFIEERTEAQKDDLVYVPNVTMKQSSHYTHFKLF